MNSKQKRKENVTRRTNAYNVRNAIRSFVRLSNVYSLLSLESIKTFKQGDYLTLDLNFLIVRNKSFASNFKLFFCFCPKKTQNTFSLFMSIKKDTSFFFVRIIHTLYYFQFGKSAKNTANGKRN